MFHRMALIGAMLIGLAVSTAEAADGTRAAEGTNLLPDIAGPRNWAVWNRSGMGSDACTTTPEDGSLRVDVPKRQSSASGERGLGCTKASIKAGTVYTLRFTAKASEPWQITMSAMEPSKRGESIVGQAPIELKTSWQTYVCRIAPVRDSTPQTWVPYFEFGDKFGTVWFRNVTLVRGEGGEPAAGPAPGSAPPSASALAPAPAAAPTPAPIPAPGGSPLPNNASPDQGVVKGESANLLPAVTDTQRWMLTNPSRIPEASFAPEEGSLRVDITKLKDQPARGDLSLECMGIEGKAGKAYNLRFTAKASEPRQITIAAFEPAKRDESIIGQAATELKTTWQTYVCRIVLTRDCTSFTRLPAFEFGDKVGSIWFRNVTLVPADGTAAAGTPAPAPSPAPGLAPGPGPAGARNLLANATSANQWTVALKGNAKGDISEEDNRLRVTVTAAGADRTNFQIQHRAVAITAGQSLSLKFSARCGKPRKITISSQEAQPATGELTEQVVLDIGTEWKEYTCKFTFPKGSTSPNNLFPIIELGDQVGAIWLRDIVLMDGDAQSAAASTPQGPRAGTPPNPTGNASASSIPDMTKEGVWRLTWRGARGTTRKEGNVLQINFTGEGENFGIPALTYPHLPFPDAKGYRIKFSAKSSGPVQVKVVAQSDDQLHERDFSTPVDLALTGEWHEYDMVLVVAKPADADLFTLSFQMPERKEAGISFRNMSLIPE